MWGFSVDFRGWIIPHTLVLWFRCFLIFKHKNIMDKIKCITFDKNAQDSLPQHIKDKMKADREAVQNGGKSYLCTNCKRSNVFSRKPSKPVSENIAGYCKYCGHVVWY